MIKEALHEAELRMKGALHALEEELGTIRTGRAAPALVERLHVDYYGTATPLQQLAAIAAPEPQLITIKPYDPGTVSTIEKAIRTSDLNLNPTNDGKLIRLVIPPLTQDRRHELVKMVARRVEESKVAVRNVRRDVMDDIRDMEKEKMVSEDDSHRGKDDLQKLTDHYIKLAEDAGKHKEHEISEV
ncbi:MAG: ribosome recycling factor [Anaerolineae bacterium]|nr:ribosome recycling factor [Anaerolineae bacterium]